MAVAEDKKITIMLFTDQLYFLLEFKNFVKPTPHFYTFPEHLLLLFGFKLHTYMDSVGSVKQKAQRAEGMIGKYPLRIVQICNMKLPTYVPAYTCFYPLLVPSQ